MTRSLSMEIVNHSDRLRSAAVTVEQWAEVRRLEQIAVQACELEVLGERILSAVMPARRTDAPHPLDIPEFLRRA